MANECSHADIKYTNSGDWERFIICTLCGEDFSEVPKSAHVSWDLLVRVLKACADEHDSMGCYTCDDIGVPCAMKPAVNLMKVIS